MKKIILSLVMVFAMASLVVGATRAYFSDTETSTGNTFAAGTLDLNVDGGNTNVVKFTLSDIVPGSSGTGYWTVKNVGSINGFLDLESKSVVNDDNTCTEPEATDGDVTCGATQGELGANMNIVLFIDNNHDGVVDPGDVTLYTGTLDGLVSATVADISLNAGVEKYLSMNWSVPTTVGNVIQSDSSNFGMTFELGQTAAQ